jgi:PhnB protein
MNTVIHPYLNYGGNCREAFTYYADKLGGKIVAMMTFDQAPPEIQGGGMKADSVMYAQMQIGDGHLMGSDAPPERYQPMRSAYVMLGVHSNEEAEKAYDALKDGGEIFMSITETFFAHRFAMLRDKFGASWMIIHGKNPSSQA